MSAAGDTPLLDRRSAGEILADAAAIAADLGLTGPPGIGLWAGFGDSGDPAYQLLLVFSRLMEILIERLNQVPDKNFLAFLDMVGVEPSPGAPASVPVTFLPSAKAPEGGFIPPGTQVATTQTDQADAQIFETRAPMYVTAAKLLTIVNLLPAADRYALIPPPVLPPKLDPDPAAAVPEWVALSESAPGLVDLPHVLYLGSPILFGRKEAVDVTLVLTIASGDASLLSAPGNFVWRRFDKDLKDWVDLPTPTYVLSGGTLRVILSSFANNEKTTVARQEEFWIACAFVGDFAAGAALPTVAAIQGTLAPAGAATSASEAPQRAFAGAKAVDLSRPFAPFGDRPRYGDALYLMSARAFGPEVATVTVTMTLKPYAVADLQRIFTGITTTTTVTTLVTWQYLSLDGTWRPLTTFQHTLTASTGSPPPITQEIRRDGVVTTVEDGTFFGPPGLAQATFTFARPADMGTGKVQGEDGSWIRALLKSDAPYGSDAFIASATPLTIVPSTLVPPVVEAAELSFTYKSTLIDVVGAVTENGLRQLDHRLGTAAPLYPLQPIVAPLAQTLPDGAELAFAGGNALYLGFDRPFGDVAISFYFKLRDNFPSVDTPAETGLPLVTWEYLAPGPSWKPLDVVDDETADLTSSGTVSVLGPSDPLASALLNPTPAVPAPSLYWLRARLASGSYDHPPALRGVFLNTVLADNQVTSRIDLIAGSGSGEPGQRLFLLKAPVLAGELWVREPEPPPQAELDELFAELREAEGPFASETPVVSIDDVLDVRAPPPVPAAGAAAVATPPGREVWVRWRRVPNFLGSGPRSRHYTLNPLSGELAFGDGKQQGMLPPVAKDDLVIRNYRTGGGAAGARAAMPLAVKELKSSLPYVEKVFNVEAATGGSDPWTLDDIFRFGPQLIKNKGRAVSAEDFEWMVLEAFSEVARAKCLSTRAPGPAGLVVKPGAVTMVVVPRSADRKPRPSSALLRQIADFLAEQCLGSIVSDVHALGPGFSEVTVQARVRAKDPRESSEIERRATRALEDFFHPLTGGEDGRGWAFGRDVQLSEVFAVLQRVEGVDYVDSAVLVGAPAGASSLAIGENDLVTSGVHDIEMI